MKKIAIVTPELAGLFKNGGLGTNYFYRARFLSEAGCAVTILYTGACTEAEAATWREQFGRPNLRLERLPAAPSSGTSWRELHERAVAAHGWLASQTWDEIHLPEYLANGLVCAQAKLAGLAYQQTRLVITMHTPSRGCRESMRQWSVSPADDCKLDYAERFCCEHADTLISPSAYLIQWAENLGWRLPTDRWVLPSLYEPPAPGAGLPPVNARHLIFFGRLETRKGLGIFCAAIDRLAKAGRPPARIDFVGKFGTHEDRPTEPFLRKKIREWPAAETRILSNLGTFAALKYIRQSGGVVVIASLNDNLPYTVIECLNHGIPFVATRVGGIPEMADPSVLVAPDADSLANRLAEWQTNPPTKPLAHPYQIEKVREQWRAFLASTGPAQAGPDATPPRISICLHHYNHGQFLPEALASLARQTWTPFEVVVVDDGSTDAFSLEVWEQLRTQYPHFRFLRQANGGPGAARNFAAAQCTGEWVLFMDADSVARETMLANFVRALQVSGADCATCYFDVFADDQLDAQKPPLFQGRVLGPCLEAGWRENVFGATPFIIKKRVFLALQGFDTSPGNTVADWQFLIRLAARGYRQIVIPQSLYWHRHRPDDQKQNGDPVEATRVVLETYRKNFGDWAATGLDHYVLGSYLDEMSNAPRSGSASVRGIATTLPTPKAQKNRFRKLQRSAAKRLRKLAGWIEQL